MYDPIGGFLESGDLEVSADEFMVDENGIYCYDKTRLPEVHGKCLAKVSDGMKKSIERIFVHNTFLSRKERQPYYDLAKKLGYEVHALWMLNEHGNQSEHGVPEDTMERMHTKQVKDLTAT